MSERIVGRRSRVITGSFLGVFVLACGIAFLLDRDDERVDSAGRQAGVASEDDDRLVSSSSKSVDGQVLSKNISSRPTSTAAFTLRWQRESVDSELMAELERNAASPLETVINAEGGIDVMDWLIAGNVGLGRDDPRSEILIGCYRQYEPVVAGDCAWDTSIVITRTPGNRGRVDYVRNWVGREQAPACARYAECMTAAWADREFPLPPGDNLHLAARFGGRSLNLGQLRGQAHIDAMRKVLDETRRDIERMISSSEDLDAPGVKWNLTFYKARATFLEQALENAERG